MAQPRHDHLAGAKFFYRLDGQRIQIDTGAQLVLWQCLVKHFRGTFHRTDKDGAQPTQASRHSRLKRFRRPHIGHPRRQGRGRDTMFDQGNDDGVKDAAFLGRGLAAR